MSIGIFFVLLVIRGLAVIKLYVESDGVTHYYGMLSHEEVRVQVERMRDDRPTSAEIVLGSLLVTIY